MVQAHRAPVRVRPAIAPRPPRFPPARIAPRCTRGPARRAASRATGVRRAGTVRIEHVRRVPQLPMAMHGIDADDHRLALADLLPAQFVRHCGSAHQQRRGRIKTQGFLHHAAGYWQTFGRPFPTCRPAPPRRPALAIRDGARAGTASSSPRQRWCPSPPGTGPAHCPATGQHHRAVQADLAPRLLSSSRVPPPSAAPRPGCAALPDRRECPPADHASFQAKAACRAGRTGKRHITGNVSGDLIAVDISTPIHQRGENYPGDDFGHRDWQISLLADRPIGSRHARCCGKVSTASLHRLRSESGGGSAALGVPRFALGRRKSLAQARRISRRMKRSRA